MDLKIIIISDLANASILDSQFDYHKRQNFNHVIKISLTLCIMVIGKLILTP